MKIDETMKKHENTMKIPWNYENTLDNHENQPKTMKNHNIEKHRQRWLSLIDRISSYGIRVSKEHQYCIASKKTIAIASAQKIDHRSILPWWVLHTHECALCLLWGWSAYLNGINPKVLLACREGLYKGF